MENDLKIPKLAQGVRAVIFDGQTAAAQPVQLVLNLSSLSKQVSIDICDTNEGTVLSSSALADFSVLNPKFRVTRSRDAELWLELRRSHILIDDDEDRAAMLNWLRQFADGSVWARERSFWTVLAATIFMLMLSTGFSTFASLGVPWFVSQLSSQAWTTAAKQRLIAGEGARICENNQASLALEHLAQDLGHFDPVEWYFAAQGSPGAPIEHLGGNALVVHTDWLHRFEDPNQFTAALALALASEQMQSPQRLAINRRLQIAGWQIQTLSLFPSAVSTLGGTLASHFQSREDALSVDNLALATLTFHGISTSSLESLLNLYRPQDNSLGEALALPDSWLATPSIEQRRGNLSAQLALSTFLPQSGGQGATVAQLAIIQQACS